MFAQIRQDALYTGANPHADDPVLVARLSIPDDSASRAAIERGMARVLAAYPGWLNNTAPPGEALDVRMAGMLVRWSLCALNEVRGFLHAAGAEATPTGARLWLGYHHAPTSLAALQLGLHLIEHAAMHDVFDRQHSDDALHTLWAQCRAHHPDFQARVLMEAARDRDIPVQPFLTDTKIWQYGWGHRSRLFFESQSDSDSAIGHRLQHGKHLTKAVFERLGFPTPPHFLVGTPDQLPRAAGRIGWPCVVKPVDAGCGKGITAHIVNPAGLEAAYAHARNHTRQPVMVERHIPGHDHRLMVIDGKFHAAIRREPTVATGDGRHSIAALLDAINSHRTQNIVASAYLYPIPEDDLLKRHLAEQGLTLTSVPAPGQRIALRSNANLSTGGICIDVTHKIHPCLPAMAEAIAQTLRLSIAGIDYIAPDIAQHPAQGGAFIEANTTPGLHVLLAAGHDPVKLGRLILGTGPARIPLWIVLLPQRKLPLARAELPELAAAHPGIAWASDHHALLGGLALRTQQPLPWSGLFALLANPMARHIVCFASIEALQRDGLPVDKVDHLAYCGNPDELPGVWWRVLERRSGAISRHADPNECAQALRRTLTRVGAGGTAA